MNDLWTFDLFSLEATTGCDLLAGVDEAGRGPLCGPVVAAAVILDPENPIEGLRDSKKLSEKRREELAPIIKEKALAWSVAEVSAEEIDRINILQATLKAMKNAVETLSIQPTLVLVDGNRLPQLGIRAQAVVKGDDKVPAISAASILAKTYRDQKLRELDKIYPEYGFAKHKGYGVKAHLEAIRNFGVLPIHRKSFEPIASMLKDKHD